MGSTKTAVLIALFTVARAPGAFAAGEAVPSPDPLEQAARLHGQVEGRLHALRREIEELWASQKMGVPARLWSLEHLRVAAGGSEPILEVARRVQEMVDAGLVEEGKDDWCATVLESAIENEIITGQEEQERFIAIAERERKGVVFRWATWRAVEMGLALTPARGVGWFRGAAALEGQAKRQLAAAAGEKVEWVFAEQRALDATRLLFEKLMSTHPVRMALESGQLTLRAH